MAVMDINPDSMAVLTGLLYEYLPEHLVISGQDRTEIATGLANSLFMRGVRVIQVTPDFGQGEEDDLLDGTDGRPAGEGPHLTIA